MTEFMLALGDARMAFICLWPVLVPIIVLVVIILIYAPTLDFTQRASATGRSL